ncbi:hypothetical protein E7744_15600 (plasmid) [Citricoccus sp. SGAir0253]|uniref:hypothetical protein n=1 Tax=Citricoccus sp. SGAir0253 TaxID=2567881 RepID=UPI0010CCE484|nr:hypothetical protein [Citricoccus sp. SGAir0253]QCU79731.1 hypothetical protein E7744_15600 [Citricoccus sp. SGAir0253]
MITPQDVVARWGISAEALHDLRISGAGPECYVLPGTSTPRYLLHEVDDYFLHRDPDRRSQPPAFLVDSSTSELLIV